MKRLRWLGVAAVLVLAAGVGLWAAVPVEPVSTSTSEQAVGAGQPVHPVSHPAPPPPPAPPAPPGDDEQAMVFTRVEGVGIGGSRIGARVRDVASEDLSAMKLDSLAGAVVEEVTADSPASKAGVKQGDVIVGFDGERVRSARQLTRLVSETPAGRTVKMDVVRGGSRMALDVTPDAGRAFGAAQPFIWQGRAAPTPGMRLHVMPEIPQIEMPDFEFLVSPSRTRLGVGVNDLTPELASYFGAEDGVLVNSVSDDSPAAKAGLKPGDVITRVGDTKVGSASELRRELARAARDDDQAADVMIGIVRDKKSMDVKVTLERPEAPAKRRVIRQGGIRV